MSLMDACKSQKFYENGFDEQQVYRQFFQKKKCGATFLILLDDSDPILLKGETNKRTRIKISIFFFQYFSVKPNTNGKYHNG